MREKININGGWRFFKGDEPKASYRGFEDDEWRNVTVPHDWSVEYDFDKSYASSTGYLCGGIGWYRKTFDIPFDMTDKKVYITFEGIYNNSRIWCNSNHLGNRPNGYTTFTMDITDFVENKNNVISVKVDHSHLADSRWFTGSGIYRDVYLTITDNVHFDIDGLSVTTPHINNNEAIIKTDMTIINDNITDEQITVKADVIGQDSRTSDKLEFTIKGEEKSINTFNIKIDNPILWSVEQPFLYQLHVELIKDGTVIDDLDVDFGIRDFRFNSSKGFYLNDKNMKLKGVCLHHDAGCLGAATTEDIWKRRLKKLKDMGCNAIRTSHNPVAPFFLDLCDRMGFLVIEEAFDEWEGIKNKWWQGHNVYPPKHFGYGEDFPVWCEKDIKSMVLRDRNHPCIIMWSIGNEIDYPNDPYCHPYFKVMEGNNDSNKPKEEMKYDGNKPKANRLKSISKKLYTYVKECDDTRPVTAALAFPELSNLVGYSEELDIIGYNYKENLYDEHHEEYPDRILYGSENSRTTKQWMVVENNDFICGQFLWTGIDYLGEALGWPVRVSPTGFLDTAGFEKSNYYQRKSLWSDEPVLHITTMKSEDFQPEQLEDLSGDSEHWNWNLNERIQALCTTNCKSVELFLDDISLGVKNLEDYPNHCIDWEVEYKPGILKAVGETFDGKQFITELKTVSVPAKIKMNPLDTTQEADGQDISQIEIYIQDKDNNVVKYADSEITLDIEGECEFLGMENGYCDDLTPYRSRTRKTNSGRLIAYIRASKIPSRITVTASGKNLRSDEIVIQVKQS